MGQQPASFTLRLAAPPDARSVAEVQTATWKIAYAGLMPAEFLATLSAAEREPVWRSGLIERRYSILLAEVKGQVVGFSSYSKSRDTDAKAGVVGEVSAIYVLQKFWGSGIGKALLASSESALKSDGVLELTLWVLDTNTRARGFYERQGYSLDGAEKTETLKGQGGEIRELRYRKFL